MYSEIMWPSIYLTAAEAVDDASCFDLRLDRLGRHGTSQQLYLGIAWSQIVLYVALHGR